MDNQVQFDAYLTGQHTAAKPLAFGGDGDAKIVLEADPSQAPEVIQLLRAARKLMKVTFEWDD